MPLIWAYQPLAVLDNRTGFVTCDEELAARLIESGDAQDPRVGANALRFITDEPPAAPRRERAEYDDKAMVPKRRAK